MSEYIRGAGPLRSEPVDDDDLLDDDDEDLDKRGIFVGKMLFGPSSRMSVVMHIRRIIKFTDALELEN